MIKVAVIGAAGRMGRMLVTRVIEDPELKLVGALEYSESPFLGQDAGLLVNKPAAKVLITADVDEAIKYADCTVDFSSPGSSMAVAKKATEKGIAMVIGTTGLVDEQKALLKKLADSGARIVFSPNMSVGVNLLFALCDKVGKLLGTDYDIEIVEMHHNKKKDAPSGTAVRLSEILANAIGIDYEADTRHGRVGLIGPRTKHEIGMHSLRGGDVVGDHTVIFATEGERIELAHKASSRNCFVNGAIRAIKFLMTAQPGIYDMQDVLGLK